MPNVRRRLVLSCEHGGHTIPAKWSSLFRGKKELLESHRGWDPGALLVARALSGRLHAPLVAATTSRLLVDLNRSPHNPAVFSALTRPLPREERKAILDEIHRPHWARIREALDAGGNDPVLHLAVHSFTPVLDGEIRDFELGLLYDPARTAEARFAAAFKEALQRDSPGIRVRRNAPYRGNADGLTTAMRKERSKRQYLGIELELNQRAIGTGAQRAKLVEALSRAFPERGRVGG